MNNALRHHRLIQRAAKAVSSMLVLALVAGWMPANINPFTAPKAVAATGINKTIHYQGKVSGIGGSAIANGSYNVRFKIYDAITSGTLLWTETWSNATTRVTMTGGLFSVALGTHVDISTIDFNDDSLYLNIEFDPGNDDTYEEEFAPRRRFASVPYAFNADKIDGIDSTKFTRSDIDQTMSGTLTIQNTGISLITKGAVSGATLFASSGLSTSGSLVVKHTGIFGGNLTTLGILSGAALTVSGLQSCAMVATDATGVMSCGAAFTLVDGDARYVKKGGDTMTGALNIEMAEDSEFLRLSDTTNAASMGLRTGFGDPNGVVTANRSSLFFATDSGKIWKNNNSGTQWVELATGSGTLHMAKMRRAAVQSIPDSSITKIAFDTEEFDIGGIADASTNDLFTISQAGKYLITANWQIEAGLNSGKQIVAYIFKNGSSAAVQVAYSSLANSYAGVSITSTFDLVAGDTIEFYVLQNNGSASNTRTIASLQPEMSIVQLQANGMSNFWTMSGSNMYNNNSANVGIGTYRPNTKFETVGTMSGLALIVSGSSAFAGSGITLSTSGSAVFNEQSRNVDFRIEGDTIASLFFLHASTDRVGIGNLTPKAMFDVGGTMSGSALNISRGATFAGSGLILTASGYTVWNNGARNVDLRMKSVNNTGLFYLDSSADRIGIGTAAPKARFDVVGTMSGTALIVSRNAMFAGSGTIFTTSGATVFNEQSRNVDFRIEGDTNAALFVLDASADRIGIGTAAPKATFDIQGTASATTLTVSGVSTMGSGVVITRPGKNEFIRMTDQTRSRSTGIHSGSGSPVGIVSASTGSVFMDNYKGKMYIKTRGLTTTGWEEILTGSGNNGFHMAKMVRAAAQNLPTASAVTKIAFDAEEFDIGDIGDFTTNDRFNIKKAGKYLVNASWRYDIAGMGNQYVYIYKNGVQTVWNITSDSGVPSFTAEATDILNLVPGDYLEMYVLQTLGSINTATSVYDRPRMSVVQLNVVPGADIGELYGSYEQLVPGDLVSMNPERHSLIQKTTSAYESGLMGVISTQPGMVLGGDYIAPEGANAYILGLAGRVPVNVSTENGPIAVGDLLTSSSQPGIAMKATGPGPIVGQALEAYADDSRVGQVMTFINNSRIAMPVVDSGAIISAFNSSGSSMVFDSIVSSSMQRLTQTGSLRGIVSAEVSRQLALLPAQSGGSFDASDLIARISALENLGAAAPDEVMTLHVGNLLTLSGALLMTGNISANSLVLEEMFSTGGDARIGGDLHLEGALVAQSLFVPSSLTVDGSARFRGNLTVEGALNLAAGSSLTASDLFVNNALKVLGDLTVNGLATFLGMVDIKGELVVSGNQAGFAVIPQTGISVTIRFASGFTMQPVVTASPDVPVLYGISKATSTGFTIRLAGPATEMITFSWHALSTATPVATEDSATSGETVIFPVDVRGVPLSSNDLWNACIRNRTPLDPEGQPYNCNRYHDSSSWTHADLSITFTWNDPYLDLPEGYVAVYQPSAWDDGGASSSSSSVSSEASSESSSASNESSSFEESSSAESEQSSSSSSSESSAISEVSSSSQETSSVESFSSSSEATVDEPTEPEVPQDDGT